MLVGAGVKVGIGALIGDDVLSAPQKQPEANAMGSARNAMRITYGRRFMLLPRLVQGVDRHDVEGVGRTVSQTSAVRCMSCLHIESPDQEAVTRLHGWVMVSQSRGRQPNLAQGSVSFCGVCSSGDTSTGFGAHG